MTDVLIRNVDPVDLAAIDRKAERLGLSRGQYLARLVHQDARVMAGPVRVADLVALAEATSDLGDDSVMRRAWS